MKELSILFELIAHSQKQTIRQTMYKINCIQIEDMFMLIPAGIYLFKVNNRNTRTRCEICSKLTINTPERRQWALLERVFLQKANHVEKIKIHVP